MISKTGLLYHSIGLASCWINREDGMFASEEGKIFVAKNGSFLEKEFLSKEVSGRKVELDEVLPLEPENGATQEDVPHQSGTATLSWKSCC